MIIKVSMDTIEGCYKILKATGKLFLSISFVNVVVFAFLLRCNYHTKYLVGLPNFYRDALSFFSELKSL